MSNRLERFKIEEQKGHAALVADDDAVLRMLLHKQLESLGLKVDSVADGLMAVKCYQNQTYHIVFLDIQMPNLSGLQAAAAIRAWETETGIARVPIIAVTSGAASPELCFAIGMSEYLSKPVASSSLREVLNRFLDSRLCD